MNVVAVMTPEGWVDWNWTGHCSDAPAVWSHCTDRATVSLAAHVMTCRYVLHKARCEAVAYPGILFGGGSTNSVEDRGQRERDRGSGCSCNLVQEISFYIVKFS